MKTAVVILIGAVLFFLAGCQKKEPLPASPPPPVPVPLATVPVQPVPPAAEPKPVPAVQVQKEAPLQPVKKKIQPDTSEADAYAKAYANAATADKLLGRHEYLTGPTDKI